MDGLGILVVFLLALPSAMAADISFGLTQFEDKLTVTLQGGANVYHPTALRMLANGQWEQLIPEKVGGIPVGLSPGESFNLQWPPVRPDRDLSAIERLQPVMVRFFEHDGVGYGQIAFLEQPAEAGPVLVARYSGGFLEIEPEPTGHNTGTATAGISTSWLIWPQQDGIVPPDGPTRFDHRQPAAQRIEWRSVSGKLRIDTGKGQPDAFLVHEAQQGLTVQRITAGTAIRRASTTWAGRHQDLYHLALALGAFTVLVAMTSIFRAGEPRLPK